MPSHRHSRLETSPKYRNNTYILRKSQEDELLTLVPRNPQARLIFDKQVSHEVGVWLMRVLLDDIDIKHRPNLQARPSGSFPETPAF
jgi:hypothetical protein